LLRIAAGIIQPESGTIRVFGTHVERARLTTLARRGLFFLPDHDLLSNTFTIREHYEFVSGSDSGAISRVAERMGIASLIDQRPVELSSGERRRAEVGLAMMRQPLCLLADEPLRNVSPIDGEALLQAFVQMAREGCAVVITGHEVPALLATVDHVTWCTAGTTYEMGPPFMARTDERFLRDYLGSVGGV
jgi:ABC-type multidrug transport system ATPase subunit